MSESRVEDELVLENTRILVIDDNSDIHDDFRRILSKPQGVSELEQWEADLFGTEPSPVAQFQCSMDTATQGQEGLALVRAAREQGTPYALTFVDMRMPPGWDGLKTAKSIAEEDPEIQIVICTAYSDYTASEITKVFGASDRLLILKKPFDAMEVQLLALSLMAKWHQARQIEARVRELARSEEEYRALTEYDPGVIISLDCEGNVLLANRALRGLHIPAVGSSMFDYIEEAYPALAGDFQHAFDEARIEKKTSQREWVVGEPEGKIWVAWRVIPIVQEKQVVSIKIIATDVTEERRIVEALREAEEKLRQLEKMESLGSLAGGIAHDFNNMLSIIIGYADMAIGACNDEPVLDDLRHIKKAGERARKLVEQILVFSRRGPRREQAVNVVELVEETLDLLRVSAPMSIKIECDFTEEAAVVSMDPTQLQQIILNVCINGVQAMEGRDGTLAVQVHRLRLDIVPERAMLPIAPGEFIRLRVSDVGCGMDPTLIDRIFEPFFSTKANIGRGTGMGLATVHGIVGTYGGTIAVDSKLGQGTTISVYLPVAFGRTEFSMGQAEGGVEDEGVDARILLVDDEPLALEMLKQMLEGLGATVTCYVDSVKALNHFREHSDAYDLILTDLSMPRMTGDTMARAMRVIRADVPVVLCSGHDQDSVKRQGRALPDCSFLHKPVGQRELSTVLRVRLAADSGD